MCTTSDTPTGFFLAQPPGSLSSISQFTSYAACSGWDQKMVPSQGRGHNSLSDPNGQHNWMILWFYISKALIYRELPGSQSVFVPIFIQTAQNP